MPSKRRVKNADLIADRPPYNEQWLKLLEDPVITAIAERVGKTPAQVVLAWAVQRGTALLTTSTSPQRIRDNLDIVRLPEEAMRDIRDRITTNVRFNSVVGTGVPGFIPQSPQNRVA